MNTVISILLLFVYNSLHKDIYYYIAEYILNHLHEVDQMTIGELACECATSTVTIKKFLHLIGIDSFKNFKNLLMGTKTGRMNQIKERYKQFDENKMLSQIEFLSDCHLSKDTLNNHLDKIVDLIYESNHIYLFGAAYPLALGLNFIEDMVIFHKKVYFEQIGFMSVNQGFQEDDIIIFITITGRILSHNKNIFNKMYETSSKKVIISQNKIFKDFDKFDCFLQLEGYDDNETENMVIVEIFNLIKFKYYMKYINNY